MTHLLLLLAAALSGDARACEPPAVLPDAALVRGAEAQYGLFRFGGGPAGGPAGEPAGKTVEMWAVFAKSDPAAPGHDLLFLDLDADGDLSDPNERFVGGPELDYSDAVRGFHVGRLPIPGTGEVHTDVHFAHFGWKVEWDLRWRGTTVLHGGRGRARDDGVFGASSAEAPIFVPRLDRPLTFLDYETRAAEVGRAAWFRVAIGSAGVGRGSFSYVGAETLPADEVLLAALHYVDRDGVRRERAFELPYRSCGTIFCGLLDVPREADPAQRAFVRVRLQEGSALACEPTDLPFAFLDLEG